MLDRFFFFLVVVKILRHSSSATYKKLFYLNIADDWKLDMMRGLTLYSRRLHIFSDRKGGSLATILAKPTGYHSHGVERRSWQWTPSRAPPFILYFRHMAFLLFFPTHHISLFWDVALCSLSGIVPALELTPLVHPGHLAKY